MNKATPNKFNDWHTLKQTLENTSDFPTFHEREIWWCALGLNIGSEQNGKNELFERPVLIVKGYSKSQATIIPITTQHKDTPYHIQFNIVGQDSSVVLSQIRTISTKRLLRKMGTLSLKDFLIIKFRLIKMLL